MVLSCNYQGRYLHSLQVDYSMDLLFFEQHALKGLLMRRLNGEGLAATFYDHYQSQNQRTDL